jgi:predicted DNA-binding protein (UPF0251 family)
MSIDRGINLSTRVLSYLDNVKTSLLTKCSQHVIVSEGRLISGGNVARKFITQLKAEERGLTELELLQKLAADFVDQQSMADAIGVSQPAISDALKRNRFKLVCRWQYEGAPSNKGLSHE